MSKGIFITATGTDIGKTYITALIVKLLRSSGFNAGYYKPALSGAEVINGIRIPGDCCFVAETAGLADHPEDLAAYMYETAVSPHLAAQIEQRPIETDVLLANFSKLKQTYDYVAVEGCGGIICPLRLDDKTLMQTDLINLLNLDVLVVSAAGLGMINHVVLTTEYAKSQGLTVKGIILNNYDEDIFLHRNNRQTVERLTKIPVIACVANKAKQLPLSATALCKLFKEV